MTAFSDEPVQNPFILNRNEERILQAVHDLECLTLDDIMHLLQFSKGARTYVGSIMRKLSGGRDYDDQQFLYRFPVPSATKGPKERVYCLGAKAREVLAIEDVYRPSAKFRYLTYSPILHDLVLSRFLAVATTYFQAQRDYRLLETRTCYQLASNPPSISINQNGQKTTITVVPDAWLFIERVKDRSEYPLWIEIDRGTENRQKFQRLVRNRLTLAKSPQYEKMFNTTAVLFCYVTAGTPEKTDFRLDNMLRWTEDELPHKDVLVKEEELTPEDKVQLKEREQYASLFRFATIEYETMYDPPDTLFTKPVWFKPDEPDPVLLFDPVTPPNQQETGYGQGETDPNRCREHKTTATVVDSEAIGHNS